MENEFYFANIKFQYYSINDILEFNNYTKFITTINTEFILLANNNKRFLEILNNSLTIVDGFWPYLAMKYLHGYKRIVKLSGSDLSLILINYAIKNKYKIFFLGGKKKENKLALLKFKPFLKNNIGGYSPQMSSYPFEKGIEKNIREKLLSFSPDILLVGFGAPKQEFWIYDNLDFLSKINVKIVLGVGGTFRFLSGIEKRSPRILSKIGLEGVWRTLLNPKSRLKRHIKGFGALKYFFYKKL